MASPTQDVQRMTSSDMADSHDNSSATAPQKRTVRALFVPGNPAHARSQIPVARQLLQRGHEAAFLIRDQLIPPDYRSGAHIDGNEFDVCEYSGYYRSDIGRAIPRLRSYYRSRRDLFAFLAGLDFDVAVLCNDDSALFDRLLVEFCRREGRELLLIQESVRPEFRRLSLGTLFRHGGPSAMVAMPAYHLGRYLPLGPLGRKGYGRSACTMVAAAGDRFRRQLIEGGVSPEKIRVTGQPRLDGPRMTPQSSATGTPQDTGELLFCTQPTHGPQETQDRLFRDLVATCDSLEKARLRVKLHPRDCPPEHWQGLLGPDEGQHLLEVTQTRPLDECFAMADAMVTVASTTCLEAMSVGVPVGLLNYLPAPWCLPYAETGAAVSVTSREDLQPSMHQLLFNAELRNRLTSKAESVLHDELYLQDGRSAHRIADFIEEQICSKT